MKKAALLGILSVLVVEAAGCMMGPNYKRPTVSVPTGYRSAMPDQPAAAASLGNEKWWDVYQDPPLLVAQRRCSGRLVGHSAAITRRHADCRALVVWPHHAAGCLHNQHG